jgi:hypothetical protein
MLSLLSSLERRRRQWVARRGFPMNYDAFDQILDMMRCPACGTKLYNCGLSVMGCETCQRFWCEENINDCFGGCYRIWTEQYGWKLGWAARAEPKPLPAVKSGLELSAPWQPGDPAFWLDPELWSRTPEVNGRPEICWMFLDDRRSRGSKTPRRRDRVTECNGWSVIAGLGR